MRVGGRKLPVRAYVGSSLTLLSPGVAFRDSIVASYGLVVLASNLLRAVILRIPSRIPYDAIVAIGSRAESCDTSGRVNLNESVGVGISGPVRTASVGEVTMAALAVVVVALFVNVGIAVVVVVVVVCFVENYLVDNGAYNGEEGYETT